MPDAADARDRVDRVDHLHFAALLADQSAAHAQSVAHVPARYGALPVGDSAAHATLGRELPAGLAALAAAWRGSGTDRRAASMPPIRSARSSARSIVSLCWFRGSARRIRSASCSAALAGGARDSRAVHPHTAARPGVSAALAASVMLAAWLSSSLAPVPGELIAYGRRMAHERGHAAKCSTPSKAAIPPSPSRAGTTARSRSTSTATWKPPPNPTT